MDGLAVEKIESVRRNKKIGVRGFEPPTTATRTQCATRLRYTPKLVPGLSCYRITKIAFHESAEQQSLTHSTPAIYFSCMDYTQEPKFKSWKQALVDAGCEINSITPLNLLNKKNGELLFGLFDIEAQAKDGVTLPRYAVVRGHACVMVPLIINKSTGEKKFLMIQQRRTGNGRINLEFPAGMLDRNVDDPVAVAIQELHEEAHLSVDRKALFPLSNKPLYTSVGLQDEAIYFYGAILKLSPEEFNALEGKTAGDQNDNEHITITLKTKDEALAQAESCQVILALHLFETYCQLNKINLNR
jgi:ADP-sugar diphosphatase